MNILRTLIFIPAADMGKINKIDSLDPDCFILDLEDSVAFDLKDNARNNIKTKLNEKIFDINKKIFIRVNDIGSEFIAEDIRQTISLKITGFIIPKFENCKKTEKIFDFILDTEREKNIKPGTVKIILMVESARGFVELKKLHTINDFEKRIVAIAIGWEDFMKDLTNSGEITDNFLDFVRMNVVIHAKMNNLLAIDTVYKNFKDVEGLKNESIKIKRLGFDGKLAIHPVQIDIINSCFTPTDSEILKMENILVHKGKLEKEGVININGVMYDLPHLKWALKLKKYLYYLDKNRRVRD